MPRPVKETPPALEKRSQPGRLRAIILAVIVHAVFFGLIVFGVTWQSRTEAPVEAELWKEIPPTPRTGPKPPEPDPTPPKAEPILTPTASAHSSSKWRSAAAMA